MTLNSADYLVPVADWSPYGCVICGGMFLSGDPDEPLVIEAKHG
jgi:hypothetical protein